MTLEELLNTLIQRGWKPFGMGKKRKVFARGDKTVSFSYQDDEGIEFYTYLIRDVVSKESGLWQFVCEEGLVNYNEMKRVEYMHQGNKDYEQREYYNGWDDGSPKYEYRLIESALKDESELEEFLLQNIKLKGNN